METEHEECKSASAEGTALTTSELAGRIKELAEKGRFKEAERLREEMMASDPMALSDIVSTGEVIETEKTKYLDTEHITIWDDLYSGLASEEKNCLFFSLDQARVASGKLLLSQGKRNSRLFFIDSGTVTVFYRKDDKNVPLIQLGRGDIIGEDTFFGISLCTYSAVTQSKVAVKHLSRKDIEDWYDEQPGLYEKLADFCSRNGKSGLAAKNKKLDRRIFLRYPARAVVTAYLVDTQGRRTDMYFRGSVTDISRSGICFSMKCSKQETARTLLSKNLELAVVFDDKDDKVFRTYGKIVKLSFFLHNDYNVHVKFSQIIDDDAFASFPCYRGQGR